MIWPSKTIIRGCDARGDGDSPYLTRWRLLDCKWFGVYVHKFHRSDSDEHHDHPWAFASLILWRGYVEETICPVCDGTGWLMGYDYETGDQEPDDCECHLGKLRRRAWPGMILFRRAPHRHRVQLINERCAWTLILRGPYVRQWGFFTKGGWQHYKSYFQANGCGKWSRREGGGEE